MFMSVLLKVNVEDTSLAVHLRFTHVLRGYARTDDTTVLPSEATAMYYTDSHTSTSRVKTYLINSTIPGSDTVTLALTVTNYRYAGYTSNIVAESVQNVDVNYHIRAPKGK